MDGWMNEYGWMEGCIWMNGDGWNDGWRYCTDHQLFNILKNSCVLQKTTFVFLQNLVLFTQVQCPAWVAEMKYLLYCKIKCSRVSFEAHHLFLRKPLAITILWEFSV